MPGDVVLAAVLFTFVAVFGVVWWAGTQLVDRIMRGLRRLNSPEPTVQRKVGPFADKDDDTP